MKQVVIIFNCPTPVQHLIAQQISFRHGIFSILMQYMVNMVLPVPSFLLKVFIASAYLKALLRCTWGGRRWWRALWNTFDICKFLLILCFLFFNPFPSSKVFLRWRTCLGGCIFDVDATKDLIIGALSNNWLGSQLLNLIWILHHHPSPYSLLFLLPLPSILVSRSRGWFTCSWSCELCGIIWWGREELCCVLIVVAVLFVFWEVWLFLFYVQRCERGRVWVAVYIISGKISWKFWLFWFLFDNNLFSSRITFPL